MEITFHSKNCHNNEIMSFETSSGELDSMRKQHCTILNKTKELSKTHL